MSQVGPSVRVTRDPRALWRETSDAVLVLQADDSVVRLTGAGRALWLVLEQPATMAELELAFAPSPEDGLAPQLASGLADYLTELEELGLVDVAPPN